MKLIPSLRTSGKLFFTGATVGPIVDSIHNQCLLEYDLYPISLSLGDYHPFFCSSWAVPPLLGVAYVVLGGLLPRLFQAGLDSMTIQTTRRLSWGTLELRALAAVATTALIIKMSEWLVNNPHFVDSKAHIPVLLAAALAQWVLLDGTWAALLAASITSIAGPLSELPFVGHHFWHYLAGDYHPLQHVELNNVMPWLLGTNQYQDLALSSLTGPCYFAVTMDAIALGRWFDTNSEDI